MGCNCKKKGNSNKMGKAIPKSNFRKKYSEPEKRVISLSETDLKNLINKVIRNTKK